MLKALLLSLLAASALAGPTGQRESCALHCNNEGVFSYQQGVSYVYQYEARTSTSLLTTLDQTADVRITASAHIDVTSPCEYTLRLTDVVLDGSSHTEEFAEALTKSPLRFSFQDGHVESICGEVSEPAWVLNIKRGVLSTFQTSMTESRYQELQETDISGMCHTVYEQNVVEGVTEIKKEKSLSSCTQRPDQTTYITATPYTSDSHIQRIPIFNSDQMCKQAIEDGIIKTAECSESHKFRPFSSEEGGAITTVKTIMTLQSRDQSPAPSPSYEFKRMSLVFEQTTSGSSQTTVEVINQLLADLDQASHGEVRPEVPALFSNLVASLKPLDYPTLATLYSTDKESHSHKFLVDAMPLVGTAAAVGVMKDIIINGDISQSEADAWFTSLTFYKHPTSEMFTNIAPALEFNPSQSAMLGTSALLNTYCKVNADCNTVTGVDQVLRFIESQLGSGCRTFNDFDRMKVLTALKALGNAGHFVNAKQVLRRCYTEDNDVEVKVAAIEAWRHTPCQYDRSHLLAAFQDETQDSEVRIAAYLAVMTCPTETVINIVKDRLTSEAVNQVGSFIWTHLTNLQESAAQGKQWVREMIGEELLQNKFNTEALKFSRNYESSFFTNELNAGASVDSNIIFSSKSFLPRSAMLNLTLDLFGESINLFEVGGRIQGFESYIEQFFGPSGYFPQEVVEGVLKNMRQSKPDGDETTLEDFLDRATDEPEGSYYLRVLGNEISYNQFHGLNSLTQTSNPIEVLMELARQGNIDYTKSYQLIDSDYSIPTVSGLPVTLSAKGTATVALRMNGNFNANSLTNFNIEGHFHPSAAVQMDGVMMVDAHVARKGLQISSTLHTSTFVDGKVHINGGKLVDVAINTPKEKMEVIDVSTKFFIVNDNELTETQPENQVSTTCTSGSSGVQLCTEVDYLTGSDHGWQPYGGRIYIRKTDTQTGYIFKYTKTNNEVAFVFDTPGSQDNHKHSINIQKVDQAAHFNLDTPYKTAEGNIAYLWQADNKNLKVDVILDGSTYTLNTNLVTSRGNEMKMEPSLVISSPTGDLVNAKAVLSAIPTDNKYSLDVTITDLTENPIKVQASYEKTETNALVDFVWECTGYEIKMSGGAENNDGTITVNMNVDTTRSGRNSLNSAYKVVISEEGSDEGPNCVIDFDLTSTHTRMPIHMTYKIISSTRRAESKGYLIVGEDEKWETEQLVLYTRNDNLFQITTSGKVTCLKVGVNIETSNELKVTNNEFYMSLMKNFNQELATELTVELKKNEDREMIGRLVVQDDIKINVDALYTKIAEGHYKAQVVGTMNDERIAFIEGTVKNESEPGKVDLTLEAVINTPDLSTEVSANMYGDQEHAKINFNTKVDNHRYNMVVDVTRTSILLDTNVYNHIVASANINLEQPISLDVSLEWDKDNDPNKALTFSAKLQPKGLEIKSKFLEHEVLGEGNLRDDGATLQLQWAPNKIIKANITYEIFEWVKRSLSVEIDTPITGWEKQNANVAISISPTEFEARTSANWKNSEQIALSVKANLQPGVSNNALNTNILFSSTINNFELLTFTLDHKMASFNIDTIMEAAWNDIKINGAIRLAPTETGLDGSATLTSPFTQEAVVTLHHELVNTQLSTLLKAKYGTYVSTFNLNGQVNLTPVQNIDVTLKVHSPWVSDVEANVAYSFNGAAFTLSAEGKLGEKKMMLNINGTKTVNESSTEISGDLRFITPFTHTLTATLSHQHNEQQFTTQIEMTRIWSSNGNLKFHGNGHFISNNDIEFSAVLSTPDTKGSFLFTHKIANNHLNTAVKAIANNERITVSLSGTLDDSLTVANIEGEVASTFNGLDDIKIKLNSQTNETDRKSKINLSKGANSVTIDHIIAYTDIFNWANTFIINNNYMLKNTQTHTTTQYGHVVEVKWEEKVVSVKGTFTPNTSDSLDACTCAASLEIITPWEHFEHISIDLNFQKTADHLNLGLNLEHNEQKITELKYSHTLSPNAFTSEVSLATPLCETLTYKLNIECSQKTVELVLLYGELEYTINLEGNWGPGMLHGKLSITSNFMTTPVTFEGSYDVASADKTFTVTLTTDKKYEITGTFSGDFMNAKWFLASELPLEQVNHIEFKGEYGFTGFPFFLNSELKLNSQIYKFNSQVINNGIRIELDVNGQMGSIVSNWVLSYNRSSFDINIQSPFGNLRNMGANLMYNFVTEKKIDIKVLYNDNECNLTGKLEDRTLILEGTTPFNGWETLSGSLFISDTAFTAFVAKNDDKIEVSGTMHLRPLKGKAELIITTPYNGVKTISLDAIYNFHGDSRTAQFKSTYDNSELSVKGAVNLSDLQAPEMTLNLVTPFSDIRNMRAEAKWNVKNPIKTVEAVIHHNEGVYNWRLEATADSLLKGHVSSKISTPLNGWTDLAVKATFDFTTMPYAASFEYKKEAVLQKFEGHLSATQNAIQGDLITPITGWESVTFSGEYNLQNSHLVGNVQIIKESQTFEVKSDVLFNTQNPNMKIEVKTPLAQFENLELALESNLADLHKRFHISFIMNDVTYSADLNGQLALKSGIVKAIVKSPIPGFTNIEINSDYNFNADIKLAELNIKKEGQTQHFSMTGRLNGNNIIVDVITPFENFEVMKLNADYSSQPGLHSVVATFVRDSSIYDFRITVTLQATRAEIMLVTPIEVIKNVVLKGVYDILAEGVTGSVSFKRNNEIFELNTRYNFTPMKSNLLIGVETPVVGWRKLGLTLKYDLLAEKKVAEVAVQKEEFNKQLAIEASYNLESGSVQLRTPVQGFEVIGAAYTLIVESNNNKLEALVKVNQNHQEWNMSAFSQFSTEEVIIKMETPFQGFETVSIEGSVNTGTKTNKGTIKIGNYTFSLTTCYALNNMFLELTTPYTSLNHFLLSFKYNFAPSQIDATLNLTFNNIPNIIHGAIQISPRSSHLSVECTTSIPEVQNMLFNIKYDIDNRAEIVFTQVNIGENVYKLSAGGYIGEKIVLFQCDMITPCEGWNNVKFQTKIDLNNEDKALEISLERDGDVKEIVIHGKLIGSTVDFDLRTPFMGLEHFNAYGNLNRAKRSLDFHMVNDAGEASISASFHSAKLYIKSPYARMEEILWEIENEGEGVYKGMWKRNDNFVTLQITTDPTKPAFNLQIRSELNGWEFLGVTGRLNAETYEAFLSGERNERKVEVNIRGKHDTNSSYNIDIKTPYDNYGQVTGTLKYNLVRGIFKLNVESATSPFKVNINYRRQTGWVMEVFVPNEQKNTELTANIKLTGATIDFQSRFEALSSLHLEYSLQIRPIPNIHMTVNANGLDVFNLDCTVNLAEDQANFEIHVRQPEIELFSLVLDMKPEAQYAHFEIHARRANRHTTIHYHRESYATVTLLIKREEGGTEKELKIEMTGQGDLPTHGTLHFDILNSFPDEPRQTTVHVEVDRREEEKHVKIDITLPGRKLYSINLDYKINLDDMSHGEYTVGITTPDRMQAVWKNFSGTWNVENSDEASLTFTIAGTTYTANGKLGLLESDLILSTADSNSRVYLQWRFIKQGDKRDYFLKIGRPQRYAMLKLKGTITDIYHGDVEAGFKAGPFQRSEFLCTSKWQKNDDGTFTASGDFTYGQYQGTHELYFKRNAATKSANFNLKIQSNDPQYSNIDVTGDYDFLNKVKFNMESNRNGIISRIRVDISDMNPTHSRNTVEVYLPALGESSVFHITFQHDFRNYQNRYFHAIAQIGEREAYLKANWNRSADLKVLNGSLDIKSRFVGQIMISGNYNVENFANANAEAHYKRVTTDGEEKVGHLKWSRVKTDSSLETELNIDTPLEGLSHLRFELNAHYESGLHIGSILEVNDKRVVADFNINDNTVTAQLTTPFEGFESVSGTITYSFSGRNQTVTLLYERGTRRVDMNLTINRERRRKGKFELRLTTPFEVLRDLEVKGEWNKKQAIIEYRRNDVRVALQGTAQLDATNSEFNFTFTTPQGRNIVVGASYNVNDMIRGAGTAPQKIASLELQIENFDISFNVNGFRNQDRIYVEIDGHSSILGVNNLHLKLNSELDTNNRTGIFELRINEFTFNVENQFEMFPNNAGYYLRSKIDSTLTPLPALVFGLGRKLDERIITIGYGDEKEITFSVKSEDNFEHGFEGFVDIPNFGYDGVKYEVEYKFPDPNKLLIEVDINLGDGEEDIEAQFQYDSEGVEGRLTSALLGEHSVRARRSISSDDFFTEIGYNEYNLKLRGGFSNEQKNGAVLEGEVFGHQFLIDYLLQCDNQYTEGKLIIETPFQGMEKMGGLFALTNQPNNFNAKAEILLPFYRVPKITTDADLNLDGKIEGHVTITVGGEQYILKSNLVGASLSQGYRGKIELFTPYHRISHITLEGKIKQENPSKLELDFKISEPYDIHRFGLEYELTQDKFEGSLLFDGETFASSKLNLKLEGLQESHKTLELYFNDGKLVTEYNLEGSMFVFNVDSEFEQVTRQFSVEAQYPSLENMSGNLIITLGDVTHRFQGEYNIANNHVIGDIEFESTLSEGSRKLEFDLMIPRQPLEQLTFDLTLTTSQAHSFHFELDARSGLRAMVKFETPAVQSVNVVFELSGATAKLTVQTPNDTHTAKVTWRMTRKNPADYIGTVELESPFLGEHYMLSVLLAGGRTNKKIKTEMQVGSVHHMMEGNVFMTSKSGGFSINIETPFQNIEKAVLEASLDMNQEIKMHVLASLNQNVNSFDMQYDVLQNVFMAESKSPYIPTGYVKAEASLYGHVNNMQIKMTLMNAHDSITGQFIIMRENYRDQSIKLEIATPIPEFQNINFLMRFVLDEDTHFIFSLDNPVLLKVNAKFSNKPEEIKADLKVNTSIQSWEFVEANFAMPLNRFAPTAMLRIPSHSYGLEAQYENHNYSKKASAILVVDDVINDADFTIRTKAPYELGFHANHDRRQAARFHLRTDSSFIYLFM